MFKLTHIDHIQLSIPAGGEEKAREFYVNQLGMTEVDKPELLKPSGGAWFEVNDVHVHVGIEEDFKVLKKAHPAFNTENIAELKKHLDNNHIAYTIDERIPEADRIHVLDPFGNRLEFIEWHS